MIFRLLVGLQVLMDLGLGLVTLDLGPDQGQGLHQGQDHQIAPGHHSRRLRHQIQIEVEIVKGRKEEINKNIIKYQQR